MIPELELILESELHLFSDSNSRKTESKHLWGVMVPGLESISESDFHMDLIPISEKKQNHSTSKTHVMQVCKMVVVNF